MNLSAKEGFVIYKFPNSSKSYIRKGDWEVFKEQKNGFITHSFDSNEIYILQAELEELKQKVSITPPKEIDKDESINKVDYIKQLNDFISGCNTNIDKVISSRKLIHNTPHQVDLFRLYEALTEKYSSTLIYMFNIPNKGMWIGATPETLVYSSKKKTYTMALAGTKQLGESKEWEEKEIEEHQYVIDDISSKLASKNILHQINSTETSKAGAVEHLKTIINVNDNQEIEVVEIANSLHPTSAVCGMPLEKAKDFILSNENYNREFYTGYLGEIDKQRTSWLFVNLRCMKVFNKSFSLYVGGGITKGSIAEKEWEETELKSRTLLSVIEKL